MRILAKYKFNDHIGVEMGVYLSYMLFNRTNWELIKGDPSFHSDTKYYLWNKDFGLIAGVTYQVNKYLIFDLRYNYGFIRTVEFAHYNTQMFQLSMAYTPKIWIK